MYPRKYFNIPFWNYPRSLRLECPYMFFDYSEDVTIQSRRFQLGEQLVTRRIVRFRLVLDFGR